MHEPDILILYIHEVEWVSYSVQLGSFICWLHRDCYTRRETLWE